ncbi:unnamed protein product, partial [Staurois parvus]
MPFPMLLYKMRGPGVCRGPHEMPLVPFFIGFLIWPRTQGPHYPLLPGGP